MGMRLLAKWDHHLVSLNRTYRAYFYLCSSYYLECLLDETPRKNLEKNPAMSVCHTYPRIYSCYAHAWDDRPLLDQCDDRIFYRENPRMEKNRTDTEVHTKNPRINTREIIYFRRMFSDFLWIFFRGDTIKTRGKSASRISETNNKRRLVIVSWMRSVFLK